MRAVEAENLLDHDLTSELVIAGAEIVDWKDPQIWENAAPEYVVQAQLERELGLDQGKTLALSRVWGSGVFSGIGLSMPNLSTRELDILWRDYQEEITQMSFAVDEAIRGEPSSLLIGLTPREMDCLTYPAVGLRPSEISFRFKISPKTFEKHITNAKPNCVPAHAISQWQRPPGFAYCTLNGESSPIECMLFTAHLTWLSQSLGARILSDFLPFGEVEYRTSFFMPCE